MQLSAMQLSAMHLSAMRINAMHIYPAIAAMSVKVCKIQLVARAFRVINVKYHIIRGGRLSICADSRASRTIFGIYMTERGVNVCMICITRNGIIASRQLRRGRVRQSEV